MHTYTCKLPENTRGVLSVRCSLTLAIYLSIRPSILVDISSNLWEHGLFIFLPFSPISFSLSWQAVPPYIQPINPLQFRGYLNSSAEALSLNKWLPVVVVKRWSFAWLGISWEICGVSWDEVGGDCQNRALCGVSCSSAGSQQVSQP